HSGSLTGFHLFLAGTDEEIIIDILTKLNASQRQVGGLQRCDLIGDLTLLSGNFERVMVGMMTPTAMSDVHKVRRAVKVSGTEEGCLMEILASCNSEEIHRINEISKLQYGCSVEDDVVSSTSSMFPRVLVSLATGNRDEGMYVDDALAQQDAVCLYEAGERKWGIDEVQFMSVLCTWNRHHLLRVLDVYRGISIKDITDSIKSGRSGDLEDALLVTVKCMRNKPAYFAERLYKSMKGLGTDDNTLIRVMVSRSEIDMLDIRREFLTMYGKSLHSFIKGDCSGDYRKVLLKLCGGED
uniref:Annexin n=1 Tax=Coturnix japonica TaxID=93934 RepID=A0A8C2TK69_COTJA